MTSAIRSPCSVSARTSWITTPTVRVRPGGRIPDTNGAQYRLVRQLGRQGNVTAVGDDDQSIMAGAAPA